MELPHLDTFKHTFLAKLSSLPMAKYEQGLFTIPLASS